MIVMDEEGEKDDEEHGLDHDLKKGPNPAECKQQ